MKLASVEQARVGYGWVIRRLARNEIDAKTANALGLLLSGVVRAIEGSDTERRFEELERAIGMKPGTAR